MNIIGNIKNILLLPIVFELSLTFIAYLGSYESLKANESTNWLVIILSMLLSYGWIGWRTWSIAGGGIRMAFTAAFIFIFFWILLQTSLVYFGENHELVNKLQVIKGILISSTFFLLPVSLCITLVFWYVSKKLSLYRM